MRMRLSDPSILTSITAWRAAAEARVRCEIDNCWFEERVSSDRQQVFEDELGRIASWDEFRQRHADYHRTFVQVGDGLLPHTFMPKFVSRDLTRIDEKQIVVRVESLVRPLLASGISFIELRKAFDSHEHDLIERFIRTWNESAVRDARPAFATLKSAVIDELDQDDWPERLRDRLGLAHYDATAGPEPVALMEYRVEDLQEAAANAGAACALTAPTMLDSGPWPWFFPAPTELDCGRSMALFEIASDEDLVVELLHVRLSYRREHVARLGEIRRPPRPVTLARLRNHHLTALRLASGRDDFGEEMPDHVSDGA